MSLRFWLPFSRLSYTMYLVHGYFIEYLVYLLPVQFYFTHYLTVSIQWYLGYFIEYLVYLLPVQIYFTHYLTVSINVYHSINVYDS